MSAPVRKLDAGTVKARLAEATAAHAAIRDKAAERTAQDYQAAGHRHHRRKADRETS